MNLVTKTILLIGVNLIGFCTTSGPVGAFFAALAVFLSVRIYVNLCRIEELDIIIEGLDKRIELLRYSTYGDKL